MSEVLDLARELIRRRSVTPEDAGCQESLAARLERAGMHVEHLPSGPVSNLLAWHGEGSPHLMLLGHTDVVPPGPEPEWRHPPFEAVVDGERLYGRGAADMKSSVAAFVVALEDFLQACPDHAGRVSLLVTSDEEGTAEHGVRTVVPRLADRNLLPDYVLVGEPSSQRRLGDGFRIGRRGSIQARLTVCGTQGHTAYADPSENPVHRAAPLLAALTGLRFDDGSAHFPATRLQVSNIQAGTGADNVTPGEMRVWFNIRHNPDTTADALRERVDDLIRRHAPGEYTLEWRISGAPFGPAEGPLVAAVHQACRELPGVEPEPDTGGGTSDGRFLGPLGIPVVELGPVNRTIHQVDEHIVLADLERLPVLYGDVIRRVLGSAPG